MHAQFDLDDILSHNPQINRDQLEKARELNRRLHERGVRRKEYDLAPPFGGHRIFIHDDAHTDPRLVRLRQHDDAT